MTGLLPELLFVMVLAPLAAILPVVFWPGDSRGPRWIALVASLMGLACAVVVAAELVNPHGVRPTKGYDWLPQVGIRFQLGVDGISLWLVALSALLSLTAVLVSWDSIKEKTRGFYSLLLLLQAGMQGVFLAEDVILFYVFFEFTLIPLFFLIGIWGSLERRPAARKFFIYTFTGSVLTFLGLVYLVFAYSPEGSLDFSIPHLVAAAAAEPGLVSVPVQCVLFGALLVGFAIKVPMVPFHTWLPVAHVEAPTAGSVLLAGVLLKIGTYGFLRFSLPLLPAASHGFVSAITFLAVVGIIYGALLALAQDDIKRLVAYSSVSHMGFCVLGIFSLNQIGISGGLLQCINHGLATGALFAMVGMLYDRYHSRRISDYGGLARKLPVLTFFFLVFTLSSIGLPGLNGFVGEFLVLVGVFDKGLYGLGVTAALGIILGAYYMLWLVQRVFFGELKEPKHDGPPVTDLNAREVATLAPIAAICLWIGLYPGFFLEPMTADVNRISEILTPGQTPARITQDAQAPGASASGLISNRNRSR